MKTAFLSRDPVLTPEGFIGRQAELAAVADKLGQDQPQNYNLVGQPRIGKTSLLYHIYQQKLGLATGMQGIYVWVQLTRLPTPNSLTFWQFMLTQFLIAQKTAGLTPGKSVDENSPIALFDALDEEIGRSLSVVHRIIFLLDDFDLLCEGIERRDLDWLRSLITHYPESLAFVISSTRPLVKLEKQFGTTVSPLSNYFLSSWISLLTPEAATVLCQQAATMEGVPELTREDVHFLHHEVGRHPYLLKIACEYLFSVWQPVRDSSFYHRLQHEIRADTHVESFCQTLLNLLSETERQMLGQLAGGNSVPESIPLTQLRKQYALVEGQEGKTALFAEAFRYWVCHEMGIEMACEEKTAVSRPSFTPSIFHHLPEKRLVQVHWTAEPVSLTPMENRLLNYLRQHVNKVCTVEELLENVWGDSKTTAVVEKTINRLRVKIEEDAKKPRYIFSARGEGYLLRL